MKHQISITDKEFYTTQEIAEALEYNYEYVLRLCREGKLKAEKFGNTWMIDKEDFKHYCLTRAKGLKFTK